MTCAKGAARRQGCLALAAILLVGGSAFAGGEKCSRDLVDLNPDSDVDVIIHYSQPPTSHDSRMVVNHGGRYTASLMLVNSMAFSVPAGAIQDLAADPRVLFISRDRKLKGLLDYASATINADIAVQYGFDGSGIGIAVIDSGITASADFGEKKRSRIVYSQSFTGPDTTDAYGHGTHVAGILAASGDKSTGPQFTRTFRGIAPNANLISLRVLDATGGGRDSAVIAAIERAIELKETYNIRVINLSLGRPVFDSYKVDPLCQAVEAAWRAGIVVVVAAGNDGRNNSAGNNGYATITAPGNDPYVITVGAMKGMATPIRNDDVIASYSSKGPTLIDHVVKPDLVAPGNRIVSLIPESSHLDRLYPENEVAMSYYRRAHGNQRSHDYFRLSGTSMAAPMVSGAAALLLQEHPNLSPDQVKARLMKTASKSFPAQSIATDLVTGINYVSQYDIFTIGAGYLDVWAALHNFDVAPQPATSPVAWFDAASGQVYLTGTNAVWGSSAVWGTSAVWGSNAVWGTGGVWGTNAVWGSHAVWGTGTAQGLSAVWGTHAVWGSSSFDSPENVSANGEN